MLGLNGLSSSSGYVIEVVIEVSVVAVMVTAVSITSTIIWVDGPFNPQV